MITDMYTAASSLPVARHINNIILPIVYIDITHLQAAINSIANIVSINRSREI